MAKRSGPSPAAAAERGARRSSAAATGDHWKQLLRPAPQPQQLDLDEFVAELNKRLEADGCYRPGTRFVATRPALDGRPAGTTWEGPASMWPVVSRVVGSVGSDFDSGLPFYSDP